MAPARIDAERPLTEMGFDSLIAVELVTVLDLELGVEMQVLRLLQGITLSGLADAVLEQIAPATSRDVAPAVAQPAPAPVVSPVVAAPAAIVPTPVASNGAHAGNGAATNGHRAVEYASLDFSRWDLRQRVARRLVTAGFHTISRLHVEGTERIPTSGGVLVAMNHLSMLDAPMMFTIFARRATLFVNEKYQHAPVIGRLLDSVGQVIYVNPGSDNLSALDDGLAVLRGGGILGIGPEGRRSRTGALEKAQMGAAYLAVRTGVPVLPVATWGQERIAGDWRRLKRAPVHVRIGEPMQFAQGDPDPRTLADVTNRIMATLASMLPEQYRGVYAKCGITFSAKVRSDSSTTSCGTVPICITRMSSSTPMSTKRSTARRAAAGLPTMLSTCAPPSRSAIATRAPIRRAESRAISSSPVTGCVDR